MRYLSILLIFVGINSQAQYGNDWIDYSQLYLKFPITQSGVHRIDYNDLNTALTAQGISLSLIDTRNIQIIGKDEEQYARIEDNGNFELEPGEYIEFFAEIDDPWLDEQLYENPGDMPDGYYPLINDTVYYYFTWTLNTQGKRMIEESDVSYPFYGSRDFLWKESHIDFGHDANRLYVRGEVRDGLSSPTYQYGEGFMSSVMSGYGDFKDANVSTTQVYTGAGAPQAQIEAVSASYNSPVQGGFNHRLNIRFGSGSILVLDTSFIGHEMIKFNFEQPPSTLSSLTRVRFQIPSNSYTPNDKQCVSSATIKYPHHFHAENTNYFKFGLPSSTDKTRFSIPASSFNGSAPFIYLINDQMNRIPMVNNGGTWEGVIPQHSLGDSLSCVMVEETNFNSVTNITPVVEGGYFVDYESFLGLNPYVIITHKSLRSGATNFATYRNSPYGGGHDTLIVDIEQLYHQYGGGIRQHPMSVVRFMDMAYNEWPEQPGHLFFLGKSIVSAHENNVGSRENPIAFLENLVPTFGYPASDNHFTHRLSGTEGYGIPTGRYSAQTNQEVEEYLLKVQAYEQHQDPNDIYNFANKEWQKNVIHFGGGSDVAQANLLAAYLNQNQEFIEDSLFGGMVTRIYKNPASPIINSNDYFRVQELLEEGVSLMTFFGHATASGGFSQNIDVPENWNNAGKTPVVMGLGCYTGDCHQQGDNSYAEQVVSPQNAGGVAFISTVKLGFISYIALYSRIWYHKASREMYGATVGELMQSTVDSLFTFSNTGVLPQSNYNGMSLQGDPALKLNIHPKPEYVLDESRIWTTPSTIDLGVDTFDLNIVVTNLGMAIEDSVNLTLTRFFTDGTDTTVTKRIHGVYNRDTLTFRVPSFHSTSPGPNQFHLSVDLPFSEVEETYDETDNNQITFTIDIKSAEVTAIWPYEYAIIPHDTITLKASTLDPLAPSRNFIFELDTVDTFSSPFLRTQTLSSVGGVIEAFPYNWTLASSGTSVTTQFTDSTVYFWRCSPDSIVKSWSERSFQYIAGKWGWGQAHFHQFDDDHFTNITADRTDNRFKFEPSVYNLLIENFVEWSSTAIGWAGTQYVINGNQRDYGGFIHPSLNLAVLDPVTIKSWETASSVEPEGIQKCLFQDMGNATCNPSPMHNGFRGSGNYDYFAYYLPFDSSMNNLAHVLEDSIPDGHYVAIWSYVLDNPGNWNGSQTHIYEHWPPELFQFFQDNGGTGFIDPNQPDDGFIFFCRKGDPSTGITVRTPDTLDVFNLGTPQQYISLQTFIEGSSTQGFIKSPVIGPASNWNTLYWEDFSLDTVSTDTSRLRIYGIDVYGNEYLELDTMLTLLDSITNLNNIVNAATHPRMRLELYAIDTSELTPIQMDRWQVLYEPVPEIAINPKRGYYFSLTNDSLEQGDSLEIAVAIENVSEFHMDSLLVKYEIENSNHVKIDIGYPRQDSLKVHQYFLDTVQLGTTSYPGQNSIWITANPYVTIYVQDQTEQYFFNNILQKNFNANIDVINPLLDVTFDGIHILDGDIVSPEPYITITLDDENEFLLMNEISDTGLFDLFILPPNTSIQQPIYFDANSTEYDLTYIPAADENNKFKIEYNPIFQEEGIYKLIVQGRDKSNNYSGDLKYEISFEVILESKITHFFNYPNPFSTRTQFVFTLTGSQIPDQVMIQIMTITGKVVKTIFKEDLGPLKIGNNRTEYFWDGRDEYGDQLANGVYLYKVTAKIDGQDIDHRETNADGFFKHQIGKMYLMR